MSNTPVAASIAVKGSQPINANFSFGTIPNSVAEMKSITISVGSHSDRPFTDCGFAPLRYQSLSQQRSSASERYSAEQSSDASIQSSDASIQSSDASIQSSDASIQSSDALIQSSDASIQSGSDTSYPLDRHQSLAVGRNPKDGGPEQLNWSTNVEKCPTKEADQRDCLAFDIFQPFGANESTCTLPLSLSTREASDTHKRIDFGLGGMLDGFKGDCLQYLGIDPSSLGLQLDSPQRLTTSLGLPWASERGPLGAYTDIGLPQFASGQSTNHQSELVLHKFFGHCDEDLLFYVFYNLPETFLQGAAAVEIFNRGWQYNTTLLEWYLCPSDSEGNGGSQVDVFHHDTMSSSVVERVDSAKFVYRNNILAEILKAFPTQKTTQSASTLQSGTITENLFMSSMPPLSASNQTPSGLQDASFSNAMSSNIFPYHVDNQNL